MKIVKRTKGGSVHYAKSIDPRGRVTALTPDKAKALLADEGQAKKVGEFYKGRPKFGVLSLEAAGEATPVAPKPPAKVVDSSVPMG